MPEEKTLSQPFITRKMLDFEHALVFSLRVSTQASVTTNLRIRGMTKEGIFTFRHTTGATGAITTSTFRIPDIPIFLTVEDIDQANEQGRVHATVILIANGDRLYELCSGFVYAQKGISWPTSSNVDAVPGHGIFREFNGTNQAAGDEIVETIPNGRLWRLLAFQFTLVTAATAGSRRVHAVIAGPGGLELDFFGSTDQIISETKNYTCAAVGVIRDEKENDKIIIPIPDNLYIPENGTIGTRTTNLAAGDDFGAPNILIEEFFTTPQ